MLESAGSDFHRFLQDAIFTHCQKKKHTVFAKSFSHERNTLYGIDVYINQYLKKKRHAGLLAMLGYDLLSELPTIRSEHVTIVPGDTMVFGDKVEVKSA